MPEVKAYIGLGSNLDNPLEHVSQALKELDALDHCRVLQASSLYSSAPMGPQDQPDYVNAVAALATGLEPEDLLDDLQMLEKRHARVRTRHWGPRTLDLDLLLYGDTLIDTARLSVPHPGITTRAFVLYPLAELDGSLVIPGAGTVETLLADCPRGGLRVIENNHQSVG